MDCNLLQQVIGVVLVTVFLAGCGAPVATLVSKAPSATSTTELPAATLKPPTTTPTPLAPTPTKATPLREGLRITKYPGNYTCFKLETLGVTIITDPFLMNEDIQPDIVTVSHAHSDHADFSHLVGKYKLINTVGKFHEKGIEVMGVAGRHNKGDVGATNIIYVFNIAGIRLAQFASQGETPTEDMFAQIGTVDVLIIQVFEWGEYGKLSAREAHDIIQRLQAKIIIPAHTEVASMDIWTALVGKEREEIPGGELVVTKDSLAKQQTAIVVSLDHE